jgi:hypothetical protein
MLTAKMDATFYDKREALVDIPCKIDISNSLITVQYENSPGYSGKEIGQGHFHLTCPELSGSATLHRFENSNVLDGYWVEEGVRGFWWIVINQNQTN